MCVSVYRGESSGVLFDDFDRRKTNAGVGFFFAEAIGLARTYAKAGTPVREFSLTPERVLDLTDVYACEPLQFILRYSLEFDAWVDRYSGECSSSATPWLESGMLYDYEGTGSGTRWNALFRLAEDEGYDAVRVIDHTDGGEGEPIVWVIFDPDKVKFQALHP